MGLVWLGLYGLFRMIFEYLEQSPLEAAVAIPLVFNYFFAAMLVMLTVSNAIIAYSSLFSGTESDFLLSAPVSLSTYVSLKYLETLFFSSWALVLLGLPLMVAMADIYEEPVAYYPFFSAFFLLFVPIPGALGLLLAWFAARFMNHTMRRRLVVTIIVVFVVSVVWVLRSVQSGEDGSTRWLHEFLYKISFVRSALLPSTWVAKGVDASIHYRSGEALAYLIVVASNAMFLSMLAVAVVSWRFTSVFDKAVSAGGAGARKASGPLGGFGGAVFFYLPRGMRMIAVKDWRMFIRDPGQWTQLAVLLGLMILYLANLPRFASAVPLEGWGMIIPFLNLGALSFILATFTSRFIFPLVSLEGRQMWLIGLLPITAAQLLMAKFAFAMTVSVVVSLFTTMLAVLVLKMPGAWAVLQVCVTMSVCVGLCGLAVGVGARLPVFGSHSAARIANSFGGTVNLVASVAMILLMLVGMGILGFHNKYTGFHGPVDSTTLAIAGTVSLIGVGSGIFALFLGARHLSHRDM